MKSTTRGEGQIKLIITLILIGITVFVAWKFIPVKLAHSSLYDKVIEQMKFAGTPGTTAKTITDNIYDSVKELNLEDYIEKRDIKVSLESSKVVVKLNYHREVKLPGWTYDWQFEINESRQIF
ncbi:MAG: hypothetical protein U0166_04855 [Acidobacteriota bacterium]